MKKTLIRIAAVVILLLAVLPVTAVTLWWVPMPAEYEVQAYKVYQASTVTGPFELTATVTGTTTNVVLPLPPGRYYWYVTWSNFWAESPPSPITNTPSFGPVKLQTGITK